MRTKNTELSPHSKKVLELLSKNDKPLSAYEILDKLHSFGIKAPSTVYRALEPLVERALVHRIESINAFVACHGEHDGHDTRAHPARFAVCRSCGNAEEIHDHRLSSLLSELAKSLKFTVEREMIELLGLCKQCASSAKTKRA
jgi:Fur family zinc uptake transcriptional regulator